MCQNRHVYISKDIEPFKVCWTEYIHKKLLINLRSGPFPEAKGCILSKLHDSFRLQRQTNVFDINYE